LLYRARSLARFQVRGIVLRRVHNRLAEWFQQFDCVLRHDAKRRWKLCALDAVVFQFRVLECGE
jgi:hypothetical protein